MEQRVSVKKCAFKGCENAPRKSSGLSFHSFPLKNRARCMKWIVNSGNEILIRNMSNLKFIKPFRLCEKHFSVNSFYNIRAARKTLMKNAIPRKYVQGTSGKKRYL